MIEISSPVVRGKVMFSEGRATPHPQGPGRKDQRKDSSERRSLPTFPQLRSGKTRNRNGGSWPIERTKFHSTFVFFMKSPSVLFACFHDHLQKLPSLFHHIITEWHPHYHIKTWTHKLGALQYTNTINIACYCTNVVYTHINNKSIISHLNNFNRQLVPGPRRKKTLTHSSRYFVASGFSLIHFFTRIWWKNKYNWTSSQPFFRLITSH